MGRRKSNRTRRQELHEPVDKTNEWFPGVRYKSRAFPPEQRTKAAKGKPHPPNLNRQTQ